MMKRLLLIWLMIALPRVAHAQEQVTRKQRADQLFDRYLYARSLPIYLDLAKKRKPDPQVIERIAECYLKTSRYQEAEEWYAKALADPQSAPGLLYAYATVLQINGRFDLAKTQFRKYYTVTRNSRDLAVKLAACDSAALWTAATPGFTVTNVQQLNSAYSDWGTAFYENGLVFTSDRVDDTKTAPDTFGWTGNGWLKLYQADPAANGLKEFQLPFARSEKDETIFHIGPAAFTAKYDTAYITLTTTVPKHLLPTDRPGESPGDRFYTRRLELFTAVKANGSWRNFTRFPWHQVGSWSVGHAAISADGKLLYFTSDMPGGEGKTDIWYCQKLANGSWSKPVNCGKTINTREEEAFPTIGPAGQLYFASKGWPGMGGYDQFSATGSKSTWTNVRNLHYPINSTADDFWLTTTDGRTGFFSSNRTGGNGGDDIYRFEALPQEPIAVIQPKPADRPQTVIALQTDPPMGTGGPEKGKSYVLNDIFYDLDQSFIRADAALVLDQLVMLLKRYPAIRIQLSSHTDARASDDYNLRLSQRRADAAMQYLVQKGIDPARLQATGYGETQPRNRCVNDVSCTEAEHQQNRRTEFRVLP
ncbi:OmpA family protein [Hufsiella ginkgonis]|uniref:OmpA family protein n=1 Tax=Hufsiella ginkgonis TaxID=2695274 RepID=A0A7K1XU09_9SPHI|nr:OmpA family protein [Hufsiella ginkgonis]MXV14249.1 OmpA family protein [Hufsiella ginkgonis]